MARQYRKPNRATYTVEEAAAKIGLGRGSTYDAIRRGEIPSIRFGKRILIPKAALERILAGTAPKPAA
jgi:excisionase family DNA binding protein